MDASPHPALTVSLSPDLLTRVAAGDRKALADLYDQSSLGLFTLLVRILPDREAATAVLQELYLDLARKAIRYDPRRGSPAAWLILSARTRALDRLRAQGPRSTSGIIDGAPTGMFAPAIEKAVPFHDLPLQRVVMQTLAELSIPQQKALEMAYYQGLLVSEIAVRLNEPVATIKSRLKLALTKLQQAMTPIGPT